MDGVVPRPFFVTGIGDQVVVPFGMELTDPGHGRFDLKYGPKTQPEYVGALVFASAARWAVTIDGALQFKRGQEKSRLQSKPAFVRFFPEVRENPGRKTPAYGAGVFRIIQRRLLL